VTATREARLVELVDAAGSAVGESTVAHAHEAPGVLHRAFSVHLMDERGRLLLQRRAAGKTRFPRRWANACCGHPGPGEEVGAAAARRLAEELSVTGVPLAEIGVYAYRADDPGTGHVECEYDHVLLGRVTDGLAVRPNPDEVDAVRWVTPVTLSAELAAAPESFAPWLAGVVALLHEA
jgi:isopentenyl-diphosphate Delta-isomerase